MKNFKINFAPLQGYTDYIFRQTHKECFGGIDEYYSPFLRLQHNNTLRNKDIRDVAPENNIAINCVPQIIGGNIEEIKTLFNYLSERDYKRVDINLGCPFSMIIHSGRGAKTLGDLEKIRAILSLIENNPQLSISLKMRLGLNTVEDSLKLLPYINKVNLHSIVLHARLAKAGYKGNVDMEGFTSFYNNCNHNLYYNGDLLTIKDINDIRNRFPKLSGVMIGRGLLYDPALALKYREYEFYMEEEINSMEEESYSRFEEELKIKNINDYLTNCDNKSIYKEEYFRFHNLLLERYSKTLEGGEHQILQKMKTLWEYFLPQADKKTLKSIKKARNIRIYLDVVNSLFKNLEL